MFRFIHFIPAVNLFFLHNLNNIQRPLIYKNRKSKLLNTLILQNKDRMCLQIRGQNRIWKLIYKGIGFMVYFCFCMNEFYDMMSIIYGINYYIGKYQILFILIGISCSFSKKNRVRSFKILCIALLITLATYIFNPDYIITFGILHFLGVSILLFTFIRNLSNLILFILGTTIIMLSYSLHKISVNHNLFFPLGLITNSFLSADYYPLIPWFGLFIYGGVLGKILYSRKIRIVEPKLSILPITKLGQNTLFIYIIHQPIILIILKIISLMKVP